MNVSVFPGGRRRLAAGHMDVRNLAIHEIILVFFSKLH